MPQLKKILISIDHAATGGCQEVINTWLNNFPKHQLDILVVVLHGNGEYLKRYHQAGVRTITLSKSKHNPLILIKYFFTIKNFKPDVIHNNLVISSTFGPIFAKQLSVKKIINHVHAEIPLRGVYRYLKPLYKIGCQYSDLIIAVSGKVKLNLVNKYQISENSITILANTYNIKIKECKSELITKLKEQYKLPDNAFICGVSGTLVYYKNQALAIRAINTLAKSHKNLYLFIAGDGPDKENLNNLILELNLNQRVFLLGKLPHSETHFPNYNTFIHMLDAFILPSKIEGFPLVALEAMYANKFVISAKVSGIENNFIHEKEILSFDIDNQEQLINCIDQRIQMPKEKVQQLIKAAQKKVSKQYGPEYIVNCLLELYTNNHA